MLRRFLAPSSFVLVLSLAACGGGTDTAGGAGTSGGETASYAGPLTSTDVAGGQAVYAASCAGCHTNQPGSYGPNLTTLGHSPESIREVIREGRGRMPGFGAEQIGGEDLEKLLAYLASIGCVAAPAN